MNKPLISYLAARWRYYSERIGFGLLLALLLAVVGVLTQRWYLLPFAAFVVLVVAWFYAATSWQMRNMLDAGNSAEIIWALLKIDPQSRFVCLDIGLRSTALSLSHKLQRGTLKIVDVFNPQLMPDPALARLRLVAQAAVLDITADPRSLWVDGRIDQLPQRDQSVPAVVLVQVLSALVQSGDRTRLLQEAERILQPGGKLIVVEPTARSDNRWAFGAWATAEKINILLTDHHFIPTTTRPINGLLQAFSATKPQPQAEQLHFNF